MQYFKSRRYFYRRTEFFCVWQGEGRAFFSSSSFVSSAHFLAMDSPVFFLQSLLCLAAARQFLVLRNFLAFFHTLASHLFLGFLAGHPLKLPSRIHLGILLTSILTTCPAHCNLLTHMYEIGQFFLTVSSSLYYAPNAINLNWFKYSLGIPLSKKLIICANTLMV